MNGVHAATFRAIEALERASIPYALMGGVATQAIAIPTATYDVDLTIEDQAVDRALAALTSAGFELPEAHRKGFRDVLGGMNKVRVIWPGPERPVEVDVFIVIVLYELLAWRPEDRGSIQNLLLANPALNLDHLRNWAGRLEVAARLEEALTERDRFWNE